MGALASPRSPRRLARLTPLVWLAAAAAALGCGPSDFDPPTKINSVRVLASRANPQKSYAKPGDEVELEVLAFDGRETKPRPMRVFWIPFLCVNPRSDLYYACFAPNFGNPTTDASGSGGGAGAGVGGLDQLKPGIDLSPFLPTGPTYKVTIPADIVDKHPPVNGVPEPYGLAIVFNVACAGHIEIVDVDPNAGPQSVPLGCFDEQHNKLPPTDYVIGFTRVYAYKERSNADPKIDSVTVDGNPIALTPPDSDKNAPYGITIDKCAPGCDSVKLDVQVPDDSQELNPGDLDPDGNTRKEQLWVDYYATDGSIGGEARLLYDPRAGKVSPSEITYRPPEEPREGFLFVVVHDNRDGVNWLQIPLHVR